MSVGGRGALDIYRYKDRPVSFGGREADVGGSGCERCPVVVVVAAGRTRTGLGWTLYDMSHMAKLGVYFESFDIICCMFFIFCGPRKAPPVHVHGPPPSNPFVRKSHAHVLFVFL